MGRLSPEKQKQLEALEAERDAADDDDDDYAWVRLENGNVVRLHGKRLAAYLKRNGLDEDDTAGATQADPVDPDEGAPTAAPAKKTVPAKKVAGKKPAPVATGDPEEGAELEADEPPATARRRGVTDYF